MCCNASPVQALVKEIGQEWFGFGFNLKNRLISWFNSRFNSNST